LKNEPELSERGCVAEVARDCLTTDGEWRGYGELDVRACSALC